MKRTKMAVARLEADRAKLARLGRKVTVLEQEIAQTRVAYDAGIERVIIDLVRENEITKLPIGVIIEGLTRLGRPVDGKTYDQGDVATPMAGAEPSSALESRSVVEIFVKLSGNASEENRQKLLASGLHWNGRAGGWAGEGDQATLERLRMDFPGRVLKPVLAPAVDQGSLADNKLAHYVEGQPTDPAAAPEEMVEVPGEALTPVQLDKSVESASTAPDNEETSSLGRTAPPILRASPQPGRSFPKLNLPKST